MARTLMGLETEYALSVIGKDGQPIERGDIISKIFSHIKKSPCLPDRLGQRFFLANGSCLYVDTGLHIELATPECERPEEVLSYQAAGETFLSNILHKVEKSDPRIEELILTRCNVDYANESTATWGCHESYLARRRPMGFADRLLPHLVSRLVITGAGGWNSSGSRMQFLLSPRVPHLCKKISDNSTRERGIFHTKNESLSKEGYHRLHLLCGESNCSEKAAYLKLGTTALVIVLIGADLLPDDGFLLKDNLTAMRSFAEDCSCSKMTALDKEDQVTAIQIQRYYLHQAETHRNHQAMPNWAGEVCAHWRETLDALERDPLSLSTVLDWPLKLSLFKDYVRRKECSWDNLSDPEFVPEIRAELFEIDWRFGQINGRGVFGNLSRQGILNHSIVNQEDIQRAMDNPPATGRARIRGKAIKKLADNGSDTYCSCDWFGIWDTKYRRWLDLTAPFTRKEKWQELNESDQWSEVRDRGRSSLTSLRERALDLFINGRFPEAEDIYRRLLQVNFETAGTLCHLARILIITDREVEAREVLEIAWEQRRHAAGYVTPRIQFLFLLLDLLTHDDEVISIAIGRMKSVLTNGNAHLDWTIQPVLEHCRPRLNPAKFSLLRALSKVLNSRNNLAALEQFPAWREQPAVSLE